MDISNLELVGRLLLSLVLGSIIGWEREVVRMPAGLRTYMLVTMGSALFTMVSFLVVKQGEAVDITRIAAGVITGIGFLGAGAIIRSGENVRGLSTAASIWTAAAIGMAVGFGYYLLSVVATILTLIVLLMSALERKWVKDKK